MLIKYNKNNLHALATFDGKVIHWLRPGWNEFPSKVFALYEKDEEIMRMMKEGTIELMDEKAKVGKKVVHIGKGDAELNLKLLDEKKAIEVVKSTYNREMLQRWLDEETRHKVKRALDTQIKPLLPEQSAAEA